MSKKASARKNGKTRVANLKPKARRETGVRGGSTLLKAHTDATNAVVQKIG